MRPPRIPNLLPWEQETVYFLTICVEDRKRVLANARAWSTCRKVWRRLDQWPILCAISMPDHLHLLTAPKDRDAPIGQFLKWFKRWFNEELEPEWEWMESGFDRLLRHDESREEKWHYMRQNPVRAGLVTKPEDGPYQFGLDELA
jgi:REP element-mobilizing transposase RayT